MDRFQYYSDSSESDDGGIGLQDSNRNVSIRDNHKVILLKSPSKTIFKRQKPHILGNWPCHIYISLDFNDEASSDALHGFLSEQIQAFQQDISSRMKSRQDNHTLIMVPHVNMEFNQQSDGDERTDIHPSPSSIEGNNDSTSSQLLHISLSKPFYLQKQSISSFLKDLKQRVQCFHRTLILYLMKKTEILTNEDRTRSFLTVPVVSSLSTNGNAIQHLVALVDEVLEKYGASKYYSYAKFHVSIASWAYDSWIVDNCQEYLVKEEGPETKYEVLDFNLIVRGIHCDIGTAEKHYIPLE